MLSIANDMDIYSALTQLVGRHKGHPGGKNYCSNNTQSSVFDEDPTWPGNNFRKIFRLKNNSKEVVESVGNVSSGPTDIDFFKFEFINKTRAIFVGIKGFNLH